MLLLFSLVGKKAAGKQQCWVGIWQHTKIATGDDNTYYIQMIDNKKLLYYSSSTTIKQNHLLRTFHLPSTVVKALDLC